MSLKATQYLLVLCFVAFAVMPVWGGLAYAAAWVALAVGTVARVRKARAVLDAHFAELGTLPPEALAWARRSPLAYVWPDAATAWGTTWQMTGLLALLLAPCVVGHALLFQRWWLLVLLPVLAAQLLLGGWLSTRLKVGERMNDGGAKGDRALHDALTTKVALKSAVGLWPPEPSPDRAP